MPAMTLWTEFVTAAPELAAFAVSRLKGRTAYLATIRPDGSPRVHPVVVHFGGDTMFVYMGAQSPKAHDLGRDPRYALHCGVEDTEGGNGEIFVSGYASVISDPVERRMLFDMARANGFHPNDSYLLFALSIEDVRSTTYAAGQPQRTLWRSKR